MIAQNKIILIIMFIFLFLPAISWSLFEKVSTGVGEINISRSVYLKIDSPFPKGCFDSLGLVSRADCFPQNTLLLFVGSKKNDFTHIVSDWKDVFVYFVRLTPTGYFADLDKNGNLEFAIYPMVAGNNVVTDAYIYSVIGSRVEFYGLGRFNSERGKYVTDIVKGR